MAKEVVLVPREKYQKLLEDRMIVSNQSRTNPSNIDGDREEKKNINDLSNINIQNDLHNKEKSQPETEREVMEVNQHFNKGKLNDIQDTDTVKSLVSIHPDTDYGTLRENQSVKLQSTNARSYKSNNDTLKLAVPRTLASITNRQKASASKKKRYRKKWLKYN